MKYGSDLHNEDDAEIIKLLLENGANVHSKNDWALKSASRIGHTEAVRILLEHDANIHADDNYALRWASERGHIEIVVITKIRSEYTC